MEDKVIYSSNVAYDVRKDDVVYKRNAAYNTIRDSVQQQLQVNLTKDNHKRVKISTEAGESKVSANKINFFILLIIMVVLLLLTLVSTALLVVLYKQSQSEQSTLQSQINKANNDITAVLTQLATIHSNISQTRSEFNSNINAITSLLLQNTGMKPQPNCGPGLWYRVAHLNMSDPTQQCPYVWRDYSQSGIRACGRPVSSNGGCATNCYLISNQYSRVCGRVIGYQVDSPDAFRRISNKEDFDGVNITSGVQCHHVWSYVSGVSERQPSHPTAACPCSTTIRGGPPPAIGDNYYCESGNPTDRRQANHIYTEDKLWDGLQCEERCCSSTMTPPWFSVQLPAPTTDIIEVSICCDQGTNDEDTPIELLEIYVQ